MPLFTAVHERAKRLKHDVVINRTAVISRRGETRAAVARLRDTASWAATCEAVQLNDLPEVEEIHMLTGESTVLLKARTRDTQGLGDVLERIDARRHHRHAQLITVSTYLDRGPRPGAEIAGAAVSMRI